MTALSPGTWGLAQISHVAVSGVCAEEEEEEDDGIPADDSADECCELVSSSPPPPWLASRSLLVMPAKVERKAPIFFCTFPRPPSVEHAPLHSAFSRVPCSTFLRHTGHRFPSLVRDSIDLDVGEG